ncbi:DUF4124 domain-containing protein [Dokdonella sp.]|uniref:DUF4124 domain-containing protein n=1 Tax=Dokdonella sp. TaxID=2291710 RepID=UPI0025C70B76|nr:DUF4124 domain-containing protein [Dokdonella sp.]MBX3687978.1 DUF4124 domain-containing protein [Dokdonella sp.]
MNPRAPILASLSLLALAATMPLHAQSVVRCVDARGAIAYQDRPCRSDQTQRDVVIEAAPPFQPSPEYATPLPRQRRAAPHPARRPRETEPRSFECRAINGEVFYRHDRCPTSIRGTRGAPAIHVRASEVSRTEACRRIEHPARSGHERDDRVSTYERNLGRDPCRRF